MLTLIIASLGLATLGSLVLVRRAAISTAEEETTGEAYAIASGIDSPSTRPRIDDLQALRLIARIGNFRSVDLEVLTPRGRYLPPLPAPFTAASLDTNAIEADQAVAGNVGSTVFSAVPLSLDARARASFGEIPATDLPVLLVTRRVASPVNGFDYFALVALGALLVAAVVATVLAKRITAPLARAVQATSEIAGGDLSARVEVSEKDYPELKELASSMNKMAESLAEARGLERQFLMSVSHDLRTPLTAIRGYAEAIAEGAAEDPRRAAVVIEDAASRLERLVQDLLDLARLDAKRFSLEPTELDARELVESATARFAPLARSLGLALWYSPGDEAVPLFADPDRVSQVVANLVENALKFAATSVMVGAGRVAEHAAIWVDDDGPGIPPEDLGRVFDRHFSADRRAGRPVGSGLGLAIVAELVAAMGGQVRAISPAPAGRGTRMVVWLPAGREQGTYLHGSPEEARPASHRLSSRSGARPPSP